jgi:hypothetical protein
MSRIGDASVECGFLSRDCSFTRAACASTAHDALGPVVEI